MKWQLHLKDLRALPIWLYGKIYDSLNQCDEPTGTVAILTVADKYGVSAGVVYLIARQLAGVSRYGIRDGDPRLQSTQLDAEFAGLAKEYLVTLEVNPEELPEHLGISVSAAQRLYDGLTFKTVRPRVPPNYGAQWGHE